MRLATAWRGKELFLLYGGGSPAQWSTTSPPDGPVAYRVRDTNGNWSAEQTPFGEDMAASRFEVFSNTDGQLEVFYIGGNGNLYHQWQQTTGGWSGQYGFRVSAQDGGRPWQASHGLRYQQQGREPEVSSSTRTAV